MRIYNMKCLHALCGRAFDWHTKPDIYDVSKRSEFREVRCWHCGRLGAKRAWTHATPDLTVKGTWGKQASPELKGKDFYGKEERDRQLAVAGTSVIESGDTKEPLKNKIGPSAETRRDAARTAIETMLGKRGQMQLKDIIKETGLSSHAVHDVIYKDPGRIHKTGWGIYGLTGVEYREEASAS